MIYFAYGSNMDPAQMQARCAGSRMSGIGFLADHRLGFPRWSNKRRHAVASIEASPGASVWGVLYDMTAEDWTCLNCHEGYVGAGADRRRGDLSRPTRIYPAKAAGFRDRAC